MTNSTIKSLLSREVIDFNSSLLFSLRSTSWSISSSSFSFEALAYAATLTGPTKIALDYAKSLIPGSENDLVNRSWTLAYFGDVQANPHEYQDTHKVPWAKSRAARLRRFQQSGKKALRFRILDLPLLYCYYSNREWHDACKADYDIIANVDVENSIFSEEEKQFLRQQKEKLLRGFETYFRGSYGQISK